MDIDKLIEQAFSSDFIKYNEPIINGLILYIQNCKEEFSLKTNGIDIKEILNKRNDNNYKLDNEIKITINGIETIYNFNYLWDLIKNNLPKSVTKLSLPMSNIDINDLLLFPNVDTLFINDYSTLQSEDLIFIENNTKIKNIFVNSFPFNKDNLKDYACTKNKMYFNDIVINKKENKELKNVLDINCNSFNIDILNKVFADVNLKNFNVIKIQTNDNKLYKFNKTGNKVDITINDSNIDIANDIYNYAISLGYEVNSVIFSIENNKKDSISKYEKVEYTTHDYSVLDSLSTKTNLKVSYDTSFYSKSSYDEFKGLVESVKWYKKIITDYPLSPLEKLLFAYDIMKTFNYNESKNDAFDSRNPHRIIETGNIVCAGYTALLDEIINGIDPNIKIGEFSCRCYEDDDKTLIGYHSRSMVRIDDDKYNIHGIYALDPTWDSVKEKGKEVLGDDYDALSLYHYFLIPFSEYEKVFSHDSKPKFFKGKIEELNEELTSEKINEKIEEISKKEVKKDDNSLPFEEDETKLFDYEIGELLDDVTDVKDKIKSFDSRSLSFEELLYLVRNVRVAEGYKNEYLEKEMNKIERINKIYFGEEVVSEFVKQ